MDFNKRAALIYSCITLAVVGLVVGSLIWRDQRNRDRLATGPHVPGTIVSFWLNRGNARALVEFTRYQNGEPILCRTEVTLPSGDVKVGQRVSVVPRSNSCGDAAVGLDS